MLELKSFQDFIKPEAVYVTKHCAPMNFIQDEKTYTLGICTIVIGPDGQDDFDLVYDTSGDIGNYSRLSPEDKRTFATAIRKYYNDDPNEGFEFADFTASRYYHDFYRPLFDQAENEGFTESYGTPPKNPKSHYDPIF